MKGLKVDFWKDWKKNGNSSIDTVGPRGKCKASDQNQHYSTPTEITLGADVWSSNQDINLNCDNWHMKV